MVAVLQFQRLLGDSLAYSLFVTHLSFFFFGSRRQKRIDRLIDYFHQIKTVSISFLCSLSRFKSIVGNVSCSSVCSIKLWFALHVHILILVWY